MIARSQKIIFFRILLTFLVLLLFHVEAWGDFYVIPSGKRAKRTVLVSPKNTSAESGTALLNALAKITTASATNPYLIVIEPGVYDVQSTPLQMKPYVHIQGSGQDATIITSITGGDEFPPDKGTVIMSANTTLRDLTVQNIGTLAECYSLMVPAGVTDATVSDVKVHTYGTADENYGVHIMGIDGASNPYIEIVLQNVNALAENATSLNAGLRNYFHSTLVLRGGTFIARGGNNTYGIANGADDTQLQAENVIALGEEATYNYGIINGEADLILIGGSFTASGGAETYGIFNYTNSSLLAQGVIATGKNGSTTNRGLYNSMAKANLQGGTYNAIGGTSTRAVNNNRNSAELNAAGVTAMAKDASAYNYGLYNEDEAEAVLNGGSFTAQGGTTSYGIYNVDEDTVLEAYETMALCKEASSYNYGLSITGDSEARLHGGSYIGTGGSTTRGIYLSGYASVLQADGIFALAQDSSNNYGIVITQGNGEISRSTLQGETYSLYRGSGTVTLSNSRLLGTGVYGTATCVANTFGTSFYETTCP